MPTSVNGCGSGLVPASRKRKNNGRTQFDAIEAGMILYLPFVPSKALHVLSICNQPNAVFTEQFQFIPLRMSWRLVLKAFLNRWGNMLTFVGGTVSGIGIYVSATAKGPPVGNGMAILMTLFATMLAAGIVCKIGWLLLGWRDEKIKDVIGFHAQGCSDPWDWKSRQADEMARAILQRESLPSLVAVAQRAVTAGNRSYAAFCLRLAMRTPNNLEAQDLLDRLMRA